MDLDEMLALMAAQIYAVRLAGYYASALPKTKTTWDDFRAGAMRASVKEARELWDMVLAKPDE